MTMRELAKLANVSVSTVSKAFHDADDISRETRELVFETARKYGCFGKFYKGKFHKQIIAIICPELSGGFYTNYVEQMQQIIESHNGIALISADHFSKTAQSELLEYYASYLQVDGIIIFNLRGPLKKATTFLSYPFSLHRILRWIQCRSTGMCPWKKPSGCSKAWATKTSPLLAKN